MKLIVGLGNPDDKYKNTFHNLGFMAADKTAELLGAQFVKTKCKALVAEHKIGREKVIIAKPLTYMNLSGDSVGELVDFFKVDHKDLIVVYDDYDLNKGALRIRENGSGGTHNGMRNIVERIGSDFARIRIGFKPTEDTQIPLLNLVLSGIKEQDKPLFDKTVDSAAHALVDFANGVSIQNVMQKYNSRK